MTDNFLNNDNYYNKGGLNGNPRGPRPEPPKGQPSDNRYELVSNQLIHERNELRKYIIDICKSLDIDTNQSVLGANCLEFYAVLSSTAKDKTGDLQQQLRTKEQECEELNSDNRYYVSNIIILESLTDKYKQALDEIRQYRVAEINDEDEAENDTILTIINEVKEQ